jgi:protein phosphatase
MAAHGILQTPGTLAQTPPRAVPATPVFDWGAATHAGHARSHNEDAWRVSAEHGLLVLADGMGGYNAGEVASAIALDTFVAALSAESDQPPGAPGREVAMLRAMSAANAAILAAAARRPECLGMGTTLAAAWMDERMLGIAHVGDSRVYLLRGGRLARMTRDHSMCEALLEAGMIDEDGDERTMIRGVLTRALGVEPIVDPDSRSVAWLHGDRVLVCSDGLTDLVEDATLERLLAAAGSAREAADALVAAALAAGGHDNVTALAAFLSRPSPLR